MDLGELAVGVGKLEAEWARRLGPAAADFGQRQILRIVAGEAQAVSRDELREGSGDRPLDRRDAPT